MRRVLLAAGAVCALGLAGRGAAQNGAPGAAMPGQVVGSYSGTVRPVGQQAPAAAPQAGQQAAPSALQRPYDPNRPYDALTAAGVDTKNLLAPLIGPDGKPVKEPDALDRLSEKIKAFFTSDSPSERPPYTPGIARRNKERLQQMWRRD